MNERVHILVQGRVQGVGFRAFVRQRAASLGVTGWVRNVGYDQVEVLAEGPRPALDALVATCERGPQMARVDECQVHWEPARGEFQTFKVRMSR